MTTGNWIMTSIIRRFSESFKSLLVFSYPRPISSFMTSLTCLHQLPLHCLGYCFFFVLTHTQCDGHAMIECKMRLYVLIGITICLLDVTMFWSTQYYCSILYKSFILKNNKQYHNAVIIIYTLSKCTIQSSFTFHKLLMYLFKYFLPCLFSRSFLKPKNFLFIA